MAYFSPFIDSTGIHIPLYTDIRDELISQMQSIFGEDIYIDQDSMDYQQISIFARKIFDTNSFAQLVYNNRTPNTAIGVGLDNDVVYANIRRKPATNSTVRLVITGDSGTIITNGEASDGINGWLLPATVTIPSNGTITVDAVSKGKGNVQALPNTINNVVTPVFGWLSVTNTVAAVSGTNIETDASLRGRFARATRAPSETVFDSIWAAIDSIDEVTRTRGYENDTATTSTGSVPIGLPAGLPPHSITFIVEGGESTEIATAIYQTKTPGCYTNGTTEVTLESIAGNVILIRFYRPSYKTAFVKILLKKLSGYNSEFENKIKQSVSDYVMGMQLGENIYRSVIWSVSTSAMESLNNPAYSVTDIQFSSDGVTYSPTDFIVDFFEASTTTIAQVLVEVT